MDTVFSADDLTQEGAQRQHATLRARCPGTMRLDSAESLGRPTLRLRGYVCDACGTMVWKYTDERNRPITAQRRRRERVPKRGHGEVALKRGPLPG